MRQCDLSKMFSDPNWKPWPPSANYEKDFQPNVMWHNEIKRQGAAVVQRSNGGPDFALGTTITFYLENSQKTRVIGQGSIILTERGTGAFLASETVMNVLLKIGDAAPRHGPSVYGPFWFIDEAFRLVTRGFDSSKAPF